jgi:hypothetical protein
LARHKGIALPALLRGTYTPNLFPLAWGAGLVALLNYPIWFESVPIVLPPVALQAMDSAYIREVIRHTPKGEVNALQCTPDMLQRFVRNPEYSQALQETYTWVGYAGAPLDAPTGDLISQKTRVQSLMGASDVGIFPLCLNSPDDWKVSHRNTKPTTYIGIGLIEYRSTAFTLLFMATSSSTFSTTSTSYASTECLKTHALASLCIQT